MSKASYVEVIYDIFVGNKDWKELLQVCRLAIYQIYFNFSVLQLFKINLALGTNFRFRTGVGKDSSILKLLNWI